MQKQTLLAFFVVVLGLSQATRVCMTLTPVRFFHASPDAPQIDVLVNDRIIWENISYGTLTEYTYLAGNIANVRVNLAGTNITALNFTINLNETPLTVAVIGGQVEIRDIVFMDQDTVSNENSLVRILHLSPDAPAINVLARVQGRMVTLVDGLEFGQATEYTTVPPQCLDVVVETADHQQNLLEVNNVCLEGGKIYSAAAIGLLSSTDNRNQLQIKVSNDVIMDPIVPIE